MTGNEMTAVRTRQEYLICYDYGQGGLWFVIRADDRSQITQKYPFLIVFDARPGWMSEKEYAEIRREAFDIDDAPPPALAVVR
jgi:hypothetical protein